MLGRRKEEPWVRVVVGTLQGPEGRFANLELSGPPEVVGRMLRQAILGVGGKAEPVAELLQTEIGAGRVDLV